MTKVTFRGFVIFGIVLFLLVLVGRMVVRSVDITMPDLQTSPNDLSANLLFWIAIGVLIPTALWGAYVGGGKGSVWITRLAVTSMVVLVLFGPDTSQKLLLGLRSVDPTAVTKEIKSWWKTSLDQPAVPPSVATETRQVVSRSPLPRRHARVPCPSVGIHEIPMRLDEVGDFLPRFPSNCHFRFVWDPVRYGDRRPAIEMVANGDSRQVYVAGDVNGMCTDVHIPVTVRSLTLRSASSQTVVGHMVITRDRGIVDRGKCP